VAEESGGVGEEQHASGEEATEVVDTSPDIEDVDVARERESDAAVGSASVDQREVADTGVDSETLTETSEGEPEESDETAESEDVERLGKAAFDRQSREVPAPQQAFNRGFLAHSTEVFWGVRTDDDAVLVSQDYDAVDGREGVDYVASSEIGDDAREVPIPDAILDHWDEVYGGGTAVTGGDDILFVTTDDLSDDDVLWVLPADWAADVIGEE
jgi:hypothetical protein